VDSHIIIHKMQQKLFVPGTLKIFTNHISRFLKMKVQIDITNLNRWRRAAPSRMLKKLNDEAAESDWRYRNIDRPFPLL
jgi:hypothetical protein